MVQIFRTHHVCGPCFSNATVTGVSGVHVTLALTVEGTREKNCYGTTISVGGYPGTDCRGHTQQTWHGTTISLRCYPGIDCRGHTKYNCYRATISVGGYPGQELVLVRQTSSWLFRCQALMSKSILDLDLAVANTHLRIL